MRFRELHPNLKLRFALNFLSDMLGNMIHPFMTIYFAERFGLAWAGILLTINVAIGMLAGFYGGPLADRIGRKRVMLYAECLRFAGFGVMALANSPWFDSAIVTYAMVCLIQVFWGVAIPATEAMLIDCSTEENRPLVYSFGYWSWNVTVLIGGMLGGFLFKSYLFEILAAATGISILSLILMGLFLQESYIPTADSADPKQQTRNPFAFLAVYRTVLQDRIFLLYCLAGVFLLSLEFMAGRYASVRLEAELVPQTLFTWGDFRLDVDGMSMFGLLSGENALLVVALGLFVPALIRRFTDKQVLAAGILLFAFGYVIITVAVSPWLLLVSMVLATVGEITWVPANQTLMARVIPDDRRSTYLAVQGMTFQLSMMMGSFAVTLGAYFSSWEMSALFLGCGLLSLVLFFRLIDRIQPGAQQQPVPNMHGL